MECHKGFEKNAVRDSMTKLDSFPVASLIQESHHSLLGLDVPEKLVRCISESQVKSCLLKKKVGNFPGKENPKQLKSAKLFQNA